MEGNYAYKHRQGYMYFQEGIICPHMPPAIAFAWDRAMRKVQDGYINYGHWMSSHRKKHKFAKENAARFREEVRQAIKDVRRIESHYQSASWNPHFVTREEVSERVKFMQNFC